MALLRSLTRSCQPSFVRPLVRVFSIGNVCLKEQPLPPRRVILETEIDEKFLHGSGPGGQKINKTSSAVQLKHLPTGVVIKCQHTRSRPQNRKIARQLLAEKLDDMEKGDESRSAIKQARASKKKASATKKSRRKYKKLDEAKAAVQEGSITGSLAEDASQSLPPDHIPTGEVSTDPVAKATTQPS